MSEKILKDVLSSAIAKLEDAGIELAHLDAQLLLSHILKTKRIDLILRRDEKIGTAKIIHFEKLIQERINRRPTSQILGKKDFWKREIKVNEDVLTPRPETEGIIERVLKLNPKNKSISILDLCTGSGCIAAALADEFKYAKITATDISKRALQVAKENLLFANDRINLLCGDLFEALNNKTETKQFDLIVSNPPYIPENDLKALPPEVYRYEPHTALAAGTDGLAILRKIAKYAPNYLKSGGWLVMEIGFGESVVVKDMLSAEGKYTDINIDKDLAGIERIVWAKIL